MQGSRAMVLFAPIVMDRIRIDLDQLAVALSDHDSQWVLDTLTGDIVMADWVRDPDMREELGIDAGEEDDWDDGFGPLEGGRFQSIEPVESRQGFRWMENFALRQEDERVRERLLDALDRPRPFRRFKDALHEFPQVRDEWYRYEDRKLKERAREWLSARGIEAELLDAAPPPPAP